MVQEPERLHRQRHATVANPTAPKRRNVGGRDRQRGEVAHDGRIVERPNLRYFRVPFERRDVAPPPDEILARHADPHGPCDGDFAPHTRVERFDDHAATFEQRDAVVIEAKAASEVACRIADRR